MYRRSLLGLRGLNQLCRHLETRISVARMVEIGCYTGESISLFATFFKTATLYAVDCWEGDPKIEQMFDERTKWLDNIVKIKKRSNKAANGFEDSSLDFVYIDANHRYDAVRSDIEAWLPKIKGNGIIGGHDYQEAHQGVIDVVNEIWGGYDIKFEDTSWLVYLPHHQAC